MLRSLAMRSLPKPVALVVSLFLALYFVPLGAVSAWGASGPSVDVYDQCQVGNPAVAGDTCEAWTNGILNGSHNVYNEDDVTPQRLVMTFPTAGTQTVELSYLTFDHGVHAYDSLATWNQTVTNADRCANIGSPTNCVDGSPNTFPIPLDSTVHHDVGVGESPIVANHQLTGQVLTMYGGTLTGATYLGMGTYAPDYQTMQVTFTTTTADAKVMLLFGGHVAATFGPRGWGEKADGTNLGAAGVPGGSYHIRVTRVNGEAIGNRDNQLMSDAITPPAETGIATQATGQVTIGASIIDTATVTPSNAVGTVNFSVYGPDNTTCSGTPVFTSNNRPVVSGTATSAAFTPTAVGTYRWIASFTPTDPTKFDAVIGVCNAANESSVVVKRQPAISTDAQDSATLPNASISDTATVTNLTSDATGTVTFNLYGPGDTTCATSIWSNPKPLGTVTSNSATVTSDSHVVTQAGTYRWVASYSGDAKNQAVSGQCNDPNESTVVNKAPATITTDAQDTAKLPDAPINDTATLSGVTANAGGEIIFKLYGPDTTPGTPTCTEGDGGNLVFTSTAGAFPVTGPGTYGPVSVEVDKAGVYFWVATYTGDTNNLGVSGVCGDPTETSDVDKASPTISTSATDGTLPGASIHDVATVKGLTSDATGTVAFSLWANATCTGTPVFTDSKPLGTVTAHQASVTSANFTVTNAGDYNWVASYSGDANNDSATGACGDTGETSTVNPATPSISTAATNAQLPAGTIHDVATVSGLTANATGTVTFRVWSNANCDGTAVFSDTKPLGTVTAGVASVTSANYTPTAAGDYYWIASYSGDNNNVTVTGKCGDAGETSTVTKAAPSITTLADASATLPAGTLSDTASLSGLTSNATGTVIFRLYGPDATPGAPTCDQGSLAFSSPLIPIVNNGNGTATAESGDFTPTVVGTYFWVASYSGDANNADVTGACGDANETSVVNKAVTTIVTAATNAQLPAGRIHDVATVGGLTSNATGTVRFDLWSNPTCVGSPIFTDTKPLGTVTAGVATVTSANFTPTAAGSYYWIAFYSGDANNLAKQGSCGDAGETSTVTKASPQIATVADVGATLPGGMLSDTASLSGLTTTATGTVTFRLYGPDITPIVATCDVGTLAFTSTVPIVNNGNGTGSAKSGEFTPTTAGTYFWIAIYNGDANNNAVNGVCGDQGETSVVDKASPAISTSATDGTLPGASIHDVATVKGLTSDATGTVAFSLWANATCTGTPVFTDSKPLGTVTAHQASATSANFTVTNAGDYNWIASYSGDGNNNGATGTCGDEGETSTVNPATPSISTAATNAQLPAGTIHDVATVSGLTANATGTVTFRLWSNANCDGTAVFSDTKPLGTVTAGVASVTSANYTPTAAGNYYWIASYSGDNNNVTVTGKCGDAGETSTVTKATTTISTAATNAQLPAGTIRDVATVSGLTADATGTVRFDLYDNDECLGETVFSDTKPLGAVTGGVASATSANFTPTAVGDYYWIAFYSGDANNLASEGDCGDEGETSTVIKADTTITTDAADEAPATQDGTGVVLTDTATLSGATENAAGDITFTLYGPFDSLEDVSCEGEGTTVGERVSVDGNGAYESDPVTVTEFGFYTWLASYSGDVNNQAADHACALPAETVQFQATLEKTADPASGGVVQPDGSIEYTVTVGNTGDIAITDAKVTDTLPPFVTVDETSISDGGVFAAGSNPSVSAGTITWSVDLAAAGDEGDTVELTYDVTVDEDAPEGAVLVNRAVLFSLEDTTTHVVPTGDLTIVKEVSPVAGNGVVVNFGDTLTYTLNAVASGDLDQPDVVVTDYVPGYDPLRPSSGKTTYVAGSAACVGAGDCTVTEPGADGLITWELGDMAAGTSRQVTFKVTIDRPAALPDGGIPAVDILNAGAVESARTPYTPSNEVVTPVTEVLGVKIPNPPAVLPRTGALVPPAQIAGLAVLLVGLGLLLVAATRRRGRHRRG